MNIISRSGAGWRWPAIMLSAFLAGCGGSSEPPPTSGNSSFANDFERVPSPKTETSPPPPPLPPSPPVPDHNYEERRGRDYLYVAAISEEDRIKGRAAGDVLTFRYFGLNENGQHVLASINPDGSVWRTASCKSQCRVIEYSDGRRIAYSPQSVIGAAFQDAFRGKLRVAGEAKEETVEPLPPQTTPPKREADSPSSADMATDEPWEEDEPMSVQPSAE